MVYKVISRKENKSKKRGKILSIIPIIVGVVVLIILCFITLGMPSLIMTARRQTLDEAYAWQTDHYDTSFYEVLEKTDYMVEGTQGYILHAELLKNPDQSTKYIILSHGYTDNHIGSLKYASMYLQLGFNCIIYDLRGHGENEPTITTYGILEAEDLNLLIEDTLERYPEITVLGLHGESLGAATTITALKYKPDVDFVVADCGFSDIENVLKKGYRNAHLPLFTLELAEIGAKIRYNYSVKDMKPIDSLVENDIPILFIHGGKDTLILPQNSEEMAEATQGYHELHIIPDAGHAESFLTDPQMYKSYVEKYLKVLGFV